MRLLLLFGSQYVAKNENSLRYLKPKLSFVANIARNRQLDTIKQKQQELYFTISIVVCEFCYFCFLHGMLARCHTQSMRMSWSSCGISLNIWKSKPSPILNVAVSCDIRWS